MFITGGHSSMVGKIDVNISREIVEHLLRSGPHPLPRKCNTQISFQRCNHFLLVTLVNTHPVVHLSLRHAYIYKYLYLTLNAKVCWP